MVGLYNDDARISLCFDLRAALEKNIFPKITGAGGWAPFCLEVFLNVLCKVFSRHGFSPRVMDFLCMRFHVLHMLLLDNLSAWQY